MSIVENARGRSSDMERMALLLASADPLSMHMTGQHIDRIYKNGELVEEIEGHNLVVKSFLNLVMCLLKQQSGYTGIQYWAVGSGASSWDSNMPTPDIEATRLTFEIGRMPIAAEDISFLDADYNKISTPSNILEVKHIFGTNECNGVWREFGIFGGNATVSSNSGIMINKRHHAVLTKTEEMTVERIMRFTLNLV